MARADFAFAATLIRLPARLSLHLREKLLEQSVQFELRAITAVAHDGHCDVACTINLPIPDRPLLNPGSSCGPRSPRSPLQPAPPRLPWVATSCQPEPGQGPGLSLSATKLPPLRATTSALCGLVKRAAHGDANDETSEQARTGEC